MINALTFDAKKDGWETSKGFIMRQIEVPALDEKTNPVDANSVIIKIAYAGVCGSDRGIFYRQAFKDAIHNSLEKEAKSMRILGHEFFGQVVAAGSAVANVKPGDMVSGDSHITCGECYQCNIGENNVCTNEKILGISTDGIFAEQVKIPAKNLWKVSEKIRPEIAAMLDPFGNAVHSVSKFDPENKTVAVFGVGPIGMFSVLLLKHFGTKKVIAIDTNQGNLELSKQLGADGTLLLKPSAGAEHDNEVVQKILQLTDGIGVDVAMEMAGPNSSVNNCLESVRRGGHVILFGIKDGDFSIPHFSKHIIKGITWHGVIGRRIFETWETSQKVLEDESNGVQQKIWDIIMKQGNGTVLPFGGYNQVTFEEAMKNNPKVIFKM